MMISNKQTNRNVSQQTVRNFYPKNVHKTASQATMTQSQENFFRSSQSQANINPTHNQYALSQSTTPYSTSARRLDEYMSAYVSPKYQVDHSQSQQAFYNTTQSFFSSSKNNNPAAQSQQRIEYQTNLPNQASTQMNGKTFTEEVIKDKLNDARKTRQQTEVNVNLLKNRVHLLEMKEKQTMNKMIETQKKTIDIISNKTNHQQKLSNKHDMNLQNQENLIRRQMEVKQAREEKKIKDELMKQRRVQSAQDQARRIKDLKNLYSTHSQYMQEEMLLRNAQSYETVKFQEKEQEIRRKQLENTKKNYAHEMYKNKCKQEVQKKTQNELYYLELERKEQELLKKLKVSQNLQSVAINELSKVMSPQVRQALSNNSSTYFKQNQHNYYMA